MKRKCLQRNAFTLVEIVMAVIVLGILITIALPAYFRVTEKARTADAKAALASIRSSQIRYHQSNSGFGYADDLAKLDIELDSKFYILDVGGGTETSCGSAVRNLSVEWSGGTGYNISISADGNLSITPTFEYLL